MKRFIEKYIFIFIDWIFSVVDSSTLHTVIGEKLEIFYQDFNESSNKNSSGAILDENKAIFQYLSSFKDWLKIESVSNKLIDAFNECSNIRGVYNDQLACMLTESLYWKPPKHFGKAMEGIQQELPHVHIETRNSFNAKEKVTYVWKSLVEEINENQNKKDWFSKEGVRYGYSHYVARVLNSNSSAVKGIFDYLLKRTEIRKEKAFLYRNQHYASCEKFETLRITFLFLSYALANRDIRFLNIALKMNEWNFSYISKIDSSKKSLSLELLIISQFYMNLILQELVLSLLEDEYENHYTCANI